MSLQELAATPRIVAGTGARHQIAGLAGQMVQPRANILLVADAGLRAGGMVTDLAASLKAAGFGVTEFSDFSSDPSIAQTDAAAHSARREKAALVLALGGGSAIDLGKAAAAIAAAPASALAYEMCQSDFPAVSLPCICVPTTSGTGAETTRTSVLSRADKAKTWLWGTQIKPGLVVLDPELTVSLPAGLTAATGLDALVHAVEAATNRKAHAANNLYAYEAIRLVARNLERAVSHPADLGARAAMQWAAALAGMAIDNCGTSIAHNIGHAMASLAPIHHGRAVGIAMLATLPWNVEADDGAFAACSLAMGGKPTGDGFLRQFEVLARSVGLDLIPGTDFSGVSPESLVREMQQPQNVPMLNSNRRAASPAEQMELARLVLNFS